MKKWPIYLALIWMLSLSTLANAFQLSSRSGTTSGNTILGTEVQLTYQTGAGTPQTVTNSASGTSVNAIYGYDPAWAAPPTAGIEPGESATYSYQFKNVGNESDQFTVTFSATYVLSDATSWNITVNTTTFTLSQDQVSVPFDLVITASGRVTPSAYVAVSLNIECASSLNVQPYTGDNGYTYGGYGDAAQVVTTTVMMAVMTMTKTVTVNAPAGYVTNGGGSHDPVPGALLTYSIDWQNTGSQFARNIQFVDIVPTLSATLTGNITLTPVPIVPTTKSYLVNGTWTQTASKNATQLKIEYATIPAATTGNISYSLIIK